MFSTNRKTVQQFGVIVDNMIQIQDTVLRNRADLSDGQYSAQSLITLVQRLKGNVDALEALKIELALDTGATGSFVGDFNAVLAAVNAFLDWVRKNIPTSSGFLLLFTMDQNFDLKPRIFTGNTLVVLDTKLDAILQEIN